ncbi:Hsp20/alpha crystallin family protein [Janibacter alittae]|uniref:Hsp20/alpha crystallin family protein n=1 Tax=Janibacter alittae TaxID=3115209 RepID=A0ABZ2MJK0_9MICO
MMRTDALTELDALAQGLLGARSTPRSPQFMPVDVFRVGEQYVIHADLPGMDPGSIDVNMGRGVLTLTAHRTAPPEENVQWLTSERFSGSYRRQITFGDDIDPDRITANYDNGVLTVTLPLDQRALPRQISVEGKGAEPQEVSASTDEQQRIDS